MEGKIKASKLLENCKKNDITLTDEQIKKINEFDELGEAELTSITGGCWWPDHPTCKKCGSNNTWTRPCAVLAYEVNCRNCNASYKQYAWD